ncbi:hypothetical protein GCM10010129_13230 [Streptomyces fumigatiscleroticus]|nr:hypothetical protein GCM10010129_13230 [Streptomyces fumigatiscleroticus]
MDNDVSAGSTTTIVGRLALAATLLAFGLGYTEVIHGVTAADAAILARYVGGVLLFAAGLFALRERDTATGTAFTVLGALWFTWSLSAGHPVAGNAEGSFLLLFALAVLTLSFAGGDRLNLAVHRLFFVSLLLLAVGRFGDGDGLIRTGGWLAAVAGALAWYSAAAALAGWPTNLPRRAAGRGVTATG